MVDLGGEAVDGEHTAAREAGGWAVEMQLTQSPGRAERCDVYLPRPPPRRSF